MFSPCPLKVSSIKRRPLRLALFRTGSSVPRLDQALQGAGRPGIRRSADIGARTRCRSLCTRASAGTVRAVSSSCPTKCPTRSGEVLLPPSGTTRAPTRTFTTCCTDSRGRSAIDWPSAVLSLPPDQADPVSSCPPLREGPHQRGRPPVRDQIRIIEPHRDPPRGVGRLHLGSALVILRAGRPKNSHRRRPQGTLIPGDITAAHRPMDPGSGVAPGNVCTPH